MVTIQDIDTYLKQSQKMEKLYTQSGRDILEEVSI